jgi:asparagine synthase (glutamine-hydrolysing)
MCGIFSFLSDKDIDLQKLEYESDKCSHRGPDSSIGKVDSYKKSNIYFKFHRLAINGIDELSNQPFIVGDTILICNGEIYNHRELAKEYGISLESNSDCEIIIRLYYLLGIQCIELLDGVFSFILLDKKRGYLYAGHDPIGVRPLYMINSPEHLIFASEMKSLVNFVGKIQLVDPGVYLRYDIDNKKTDKITYYHRKYDIKYTDDNKCMIMIRELLYESVHKRLLTDRPFGCLLSGGLDSSIIAMFLDRIINKDRDTKIKLNTFAIGLEGSPDLISAEKMSLFLDTNHKSFIVSEKDMLDAIEPTIKQIESYDTTTVRASVPMYLLSKYISETTDIKVIFSGEGADELSGSYLYFHNSPSPESFQEECIRLLKDVQYYDVLRGDRTTSSAGLEIRVPFFDKKFVNEYMSINPELKVVRDNYEKYLLRKSFENDLPEEIVWRRKDGFSDSVSGDSRPWYKIIDEYTKNNFDKTEKQYYRHVFQKYYKGYEYIVPYEWLPKWCDEENPSGRLVAICGD